MLDTTRVTKNGWRRTYKTSPPKPIVTHREAKAVAKLQEVNEEAKKVYAMFVEKQDTLERVTQEVERLRRGYDDFDTWIKEKIERMWYESLEDKGRLDEGFC